MRVLHVTRDFPPRHCGGITTAVGGLVAALRRAGVACVVASFDDYRPSKASGRGPRRDGGAFAPPGARDGVFRIDDEADLAELERFARDFGPDRIQLHVDLLWKAADALRERLGVPLIATLHVSHRRMLRTVGAEASSVSLEAQEAALDRADALVAPTRAAAEAILEDYPQVVDRLHVAGLTVDRRPKAALEEPRLVVVGRFGAAKGTDRLVALLPYLLEAPELSIDVVGGLPRSPARDRRWRRRLAEVAGGHRDRVRFHGWLEPDRVDAILARARVMLSVSRVETFGLAALEALAHGVPVCGYREPALVETAPGQAWLDDAGPSSVARGVLALVGDRARCARLGRSGRAAIATWAERVDAWHRVYAVAARRTLDR